MELAAVQSVSRPLERAAEEVALRRAERALEDAARKDTGEPATPEQAKATLQARAEAKAQTPTLRFDHKVPEALRRCTACGRVDLTPVGAARVQDHQASAIDDQLPGAWIAVD